MAQDQWPDLCAMAQHDDGLRTRQVGYWSEYKLQFWNSYIGITTSAMVGKPQWRAGLTYVDLFAGPGICTLRESKKRIPGSPLIAANAPKSFNQIILCEKDAISAAACRTRVSSTAVSDRCHMLEGDCNELVGKIAAMIPDRALTLAFIDPTGLDARFETIATLSARGRVDLLILFADAYDVVRNVDLYRQQTDSKLDQVLGPDSGWREMWDQLENRSPWNIRRQFADIYESQLARLLKYKKFGEETIYSGKAPLYKLIYASKHERGLEFWEKIARKRPSGQMRLNLED